VVGIVTGDAEEAGDPAEQAHRRRGGGLLEAERAVDPTAVRVGMSKAADARR